MLSGLFFTPFIVGQLGLVSRQSKIFPCKRVLLQGIINLPLMHVFLLAHGLSIVLDPLSVLLLICFVPLVLIPSWLAIFNFLLDGLDLSLIPGSDLLFPFDHLLGLLSLPGVIMSHRFFVPLLVLPTAQM